MLTILYRTLCTWHGYLDACLHCVALLCIHMMVSGHFFLLNVWSPCYTWSRVKKFMGELGVIGDIIIFIQARRMGQNTKFDGIELIYALELMLRHFEVPLYAYIGKPCICNVFHPWATWGAGPGAHINVTTFTHFSQNWSLDCLLALYGSTMHPAQLCGGFQTIFSA